MISYENGKIKVEGMPTELLTVIPAPGVLLTLSTERVSCPPKSSTKFSCTFWKAVLIASALGSSGNEPKSILRIVMV